MILLALREVHGGIPEHSLSFSSLFLKYLCFQPLLGNQGNSEKLLAQPCKRVLGDCQWAPVSPCSTSIIYDWVSNVSILFPCYILDCNNCVKRNGLVEELARSILQQKCLKVTFTNWGSLAMKSCFISYMDIHFMHLKCTSLKQNIDNHFMFLKKRLDISLMKLWCAIMGDMWNNL